MTVLIRDKKLYCANAGDSRGIACRKGQLITLSNDHKPNNPEEMERIYNAGGWVEFNRVNGNLALSRALGDFLFKRNDTFPPEQQIVTGEHETKNNKNIMEISQREQLTIKLTNCRVKMCFVSTCHRSLFLIHKYFILSKLLFAFSCFSVLINNKKRKSSFPICILLLFSCCSCIFY